tara:strand:+ start:1527 stop:2051 length:525 start_codon:yes stop_codon:yes gene_type:complete
MLVRIFDIENGNVVKSEHCYTLNFLKAIIETWPKEKEHMPILQYLFYMTCPDPEMNPFFNVPEHEKEEMIVEEVGLEVSLENEIIINGVEKCRQLYETPTYRAYIGIKAMLDRLARYMETTPIEHGRDGNINSLVNTAAKFDQIRQAYKGAFSDMKQEQESQVRGGHGLAYDQI